MAKKKNKAAITVTYYYNGILALHRRIEDTVLYLSSIKYPLADEFCVFNQSQVTVRYWITDRQITLEEAESITAKMAAGVFRSRLFCRYSEITGYLWTEESMKIGGHNLLNELYNYVGKWALIEVKMHIDKAERWMSYKDGEIIERSDIDLPSGK